MWLLLNFRRDHCHRCTQGVRAEAHVICPRPAYRRALDEKKGLCQQRQQTSLSDAGALQLRGDFKHPRILLSFLLHVAPSPCSDTSIREGC
jgi:hypothetical protein